MRVPKGKKGAAVVMAVVLALAMCVPIGAWAGDEILPAEESTTILGAGEQPDGGQQPDDATAGEESVEDEAVEETADSEEPGDEQQPGAAQKNTPTQVTSQQLKAAPMSVQSPAAPVAPRATSVAEIDGTPYETLSAAFAAVPTDGVQTTIVLTDDTSSGNLMMKAGQNVVLDLAGHTLTMTGSIYARGELGICDSGTGGTIESTKSSFLRADGKGALTLESGSIETTGATAVVVNTATASFKMTGGTLTAKTNAVNAQFGTTVITGGTLTGNVSVANSITGATPSLAIGKEGVYDTPVVNGTVNVELAGATVNFYGGTVKNVTGQISTGSTVASHFENDITSALPAGMTCVQQDGAWVVQELAAENAVAKVVSADGTESFFQLASTAASQLKDGDTLVLLKDTNSQLVFGAVEATVDLNGCTLTSDAACAVSFPERGANVTIKNGSIVSASTDPNAAIVGIVGDAFTADNVSVTLSGVKLSMTDSGNAGIIVHGNNTNNSVTLDGCTLTVPNDVMGIYFPPKSGTLTVNNTTINAGTGIGVKGGTVNITGTTVINASGVAETPSEGGQSGIAETGDAIYVDGNYTDRVVQVNIESGTLTSAQGKAVQMLFADDRGEETPATVEVTGGTFDDDSAETYVAEGYELAKNEDGTYGVTELEPVAQIDDKAFTSLADAIDAVGDGETITLLANVPDAAGISVPSGKNFTIDFANHTYTLGGPGAGSTGTETNGFQLLKDSTIVFKNGTVNIAEGNTEIKRIVQSYADVTFENMTFDATNQAGGNDLPLSFNAGNVVFAGDTNIVNDPNATAFDVYYWAGAYEEGVSVTFDETFTGSIDGTILYDSTDENKAALTIEGAGTFDKIQASTASTDAPNIQISAGTFENAPDESWIVEGSGLNKNPDGTYGVHEHEAVAVPAKEATCTQAGNEAYWKCAICGELFADEAMTAPTTLEEMTVPMTDHQLVYVPAKSATADEDGNIEYWQCEVCGKMFADEAMAKELSAADVVIPAFGGDDGKRPADNGNGRDDEAGETDATSTGDAAPYLLGGVAAVAAIALAAGALARRGRKQLR